jgi:hypothetical protein
VTQRYTTEELLIFRGYLEWRRIYAGMKHTSTISKVSWPPWMDATLKKLREDTAGMTDWDTPPKH